MPTKAGTKWVVVLLSVGAVVCSAVIAHVKGQALAFHTRDYPFYLQFAAKLFDPDLSKSFSMNPFGGNWLLFYGAEGIHSFHQGLHFEPVKYIFAVLYASLNDPLTLFLFVALLYFFPPVYLALIHPLETAVDRYLVLLAAAVYGLYPTGLIVPSLDLRPIVLLAPIFVMSMMAVVARRPLWEILLLFNLQFLMREEALLLGVVVIAWAYRGRATDTSTPRVLLALVCSWMVWMAGIQTFFLWTGYPNRVLDLGATTGVVLSVLALSVAITCVLLVSSWLRSHIIHSTEIVVLLVGTLIAPTRLQFVRDQYPPLRAYDMGNALEMLQAAQRFLPPVGDILPYLILNLCVLVVAVIIGRNPNKRVGMAFLALLLGIFFLVDTVSPLAIPAVITRHSQEAESSAAVLAVRESTNKYSTSVLCDYEAYQAFFDYEHVYVYRRLPWSLVPGEERFYPANVPALQMLLMSHIEYIVIAQRSKSDIDSLLTRSGVSTMVVFENSRFVGYRILRSRL